MWYKILAIAMLIVIAAIAFVKLIAFAAKLFAIVGGILLVAIIVAPIYWLFNKVYKNKKVK